MCAVKDGKVTPLQLIARSINGGVMLANQFSDVGGFSADIRRHDHGRWWCYRRLALLAGLLFTRRVQRCSLPADDLGIFGNRGKSDLQDRRKRAMVALQPSVLHFREAPGEFIESSAGGPTEAINGLVRVADRKDS